MNMHQSGELEKILEKAGVLVPLEETEEIVSNERKEVNVGQSTVENIGVVHGGDGKGDKKHNAKKSV